MPTEFGYLVDIIVLMIGYVAISKTWKRSSKGKRFLYTMMYIYVSFVIFFTLMPVLTALPHIMEHEYIPMKTVFFEDYKLGRENAIIEIILNVIMLIPFGIMLPLLKKEKFIYVFLQTLFFTLSIELIQPLLHINRCSDITDILTNSLGGIIGYCIYLVFKPILKRMFK